jgi:fimbrial chaperone protein
MLVRNILVSVGLLLGTMLAPSAHAMSVSPIHVEMTSVGSAGRAQITVSNESANALPVETGIGRLILTEDGTNKSTAANDEFLIFPPQAIIPPGGAQVFRVQWVGDPQIKESQSYMMTVSQVPIKLPANQSAVQVVMSFGVMINVAPPQGRSDLQVAGAGTAIDKTGKRHPTVTIANNSHVHGLLQDSVLRVSAGTWSKTYQPNDIAQRVGIGLVQPGKRRKFVLPDQLPANASTVLATIEYRGKR